MKLRRANSILSANKRLLLTVTQHCREVMHKTKREGGFVINKHSMLELELQQIIEMLESHLHELALLLNTAESTRLLVSGRYQLEEVYFWVLISRQLFKILDYRNDAIIRDNSSFLRELAVMGSAESKWMLQIADHTRKDSRTMRFTSLIALVYLPASLISVHLPIHPPQTET